MEISRKERDKAMLKPVGAESQDTAVTKEQGLDEQGRADDFQTDTRTAAERKDVAMEATADGVRRTRQRQGDIEHRGREGKRPPSNAEEGSFSRGTVSLMLRMDEKAARWEP